MPHRLFKSVAASRCPRASLLLASMALAGCGADTHGGGPPAESWTGGVEAVIAANCMGCHHPGGLAPFSLATYEAARARAEAIAAAVDARRMPPWLPEPGYAAFLGDRSLSAADIDLLRRWAAAQAPRGDRARTDSAAAVADWAGEWQLGAPDLVLEPSGGYLQPARSRDTFRNFIIPVPVPRARYVQAVDLSTGGGHVVHHAIIQLDPERASRGLLDSSGASSFGGMDMGASEPPDGHFIGWTPGHAPQVNAPGYAWRLPPRSDLVLQVHLPPTDAAREVRPKIGLYFTDEPPRHQLAVVLLHVVDLDIPAGDSAYTVHDSLTLPVAVQARSIYPHAHFLGKRMHVVARLPDGSTRWLLRIDHWNFYWQDQYRFASPISLPAGTRLVMTYTYDNSSDNPRNPSSPPQRVRYGMGSFNEMGTLSLQVDLDPSDRLRLEEAMARHGLDLAPGDAESAYSLATVRLRQGHLDEALRLYGALVASHPRHLRGLTNLGATLAMTGRADSAVRVFDRVVRLAPDGAGGWYNLGRALFESGRARQATTAIARAVTLEPETADYHDLLGAVLLSQGERSRAVSAFREALRVDPADAYAARALSQLRAPASDPGPASAGRP